MKKRLITMLLALLMVMGLLPTAAFAASTPEEALGEIDIYSGGEELSYLSINGRVRTLIYTYYNYDNGSGVTREIPAYCVNPNITGVPQTVAPGESIEYLAEEKSSDPKVIGIVASGYPTRSLEELGLENKYQGYYATKMALWCYLLSNWDINNLKVNPNLTGVELQRAQKMLAAAKDIYARGTAWDEILSPQVTCTRTEMLPTRSPLTASSTSSRSSPSGRKPGCAIMRSMSPLPIRPWSRRGPGSWI